MWLQELNIAVAESQRKNASDFALTCLLAKILMPRIANLRQSFANSKNVHHPHWALEPKYLWPGNLNPHHEQIEY